MSNEELLKYALDNRNETVSTCPQVVNYFLKCSMSVFDSSGYNIPALRNYLMSYAPHKPTPEEIAAEKEANENLRASREPEHAITCMQYIDRCVNAGDLKSISRKIEKEYFGGLIKDAARIETIRKELFRKYDALTCTAGD